VLVNVIDRRENAHAASSVNAVLEPAWRSNGKPGADQYDVFTDEPETDTLYGLPLPRVFEAANDFEGPVTVYIYDAGFDPAAPRR